MLFLGRLLSLPADIVVTVCLGLAVNYLFVRNILVHRPDFLRVVVRYFLILLALAAIWFVLTGNLAVTTFVIPGICLVALVFDTVLLAVFRGTFVARYAKYLLFDVAVRPGPVGAGRAGADHLGRAGLRERFGVQRVLAVAARVHAQTASGRGPQAVHCLGSRERRRKRVARRGAGRRKEAADERAVQASCSPYATTRPLPLRFAS